MGCFTRIVGLRSDFHIDGNLEGFDLTPAMRKLNIPTLIIYGDHDLLTDATARETASALAGSRVIRIPNCGHSQFADQPVAFLEAVTTFLAGQGLSLR